jgi:hypothetical protein
MTDSHGLTLSFREQYKSIRGLPKTRLPFFSIITGANGAGKTHLLEAIRDGKIRIEGTARTGGGYVHFNSQNFNAKIAALANTGEAARMVEDRQNKWIGLWSSKWNRLEALVESWNRSRDQRLTNRQWLASATENELVDAITGALLTRTGPQKAPLGCAKEFIAAREVAEKELRDYSQDHEPLIDQDFSARPILARTKESFIHDIPVHDTRSSALSFSLAQ